MGSNADAQPMSSDLIQSPISQYVWQEKYQLKTLEGKALDLTIGDTWARVARAAASAEADEHSRKRWAERYMSVLSDGTFLPAGRILAGAGSNRHVTLFNCFVMGRIEDDLSSIFEEVKEAGSAMTSRRCARRVRRCAASGQTHQARSASWTSGIRCAGRSCRPGRAAAR
jgi:ribonucleoside-diphosphate reductase alpha chain